MRISIIILFIFIFASCIGIFKGFKVNAQSSCAEVTNVSITISSLKSTTSNSFECRVTVDAGHAGSRTIGCGISRNGNWPMNFCPSDSAFLGWNGNTASYNCSIPQGEIREGDVINIVGFDFAGNCGPQTGKSIRISVESPGQSLPPTSSQPQPTSSHIQQPTSFPQGPDNPVNVCKNLPISSWTCRTNKDCIIALLRDYFGVGGGTAPSDSPVLQPSPANNLRGWQKLCHEVGSKTDVWPDMLCAIRENESGSAYNKLPEPLEKYFVPGKLLLGNEQCPITKCSETGAMQIQTGSYDGVQGCRTGKPEQCRFRCVNTWAEGEKIINSADPTHTLHPCNIADNMYVAGKLLGKYKKESPYTDKIQTIAYMMRRYMGEDPWVQPYDRASDTGCGPKYSQFRMGTNENHSYCFYLLNKMNL